jgi:hypothetical protein
MTINNILKYYSYTFSEKHILSVFYLKKYIVALLTVYLKYKNKPGKFSSYPYDLYFKIHFNITFTSISRFPEISLSFRSLCQNFVHIFIRPYECYIGSSVSLNTLIWTLAVCGYCVFLYKNFHRIITIQSNFLTTSAFGSQYLSM